MASKINTDKIARASGTPEFTIPTADGTAKSALITDGSGVLSFATGTPSSSNFLRGDGSWQTVTTTALTGSTNTWIPTITGANALTGTANFTYDGNTLDVKNSGTASSINLYCESSNAHYQKIKAAPHAGSSNWTLTLPPTVPTVSGQSLTATTAGVASWATVGGDSTPYFYASRTGSQAGGGSGAWVKYEGDDEIIDTNGDYDDSTNYRFTPSVAGKYYIAFSGCIGSSTNAQRYLFALYRNGSQYHNSRVSVMAGMSGQEIGGVAQAILTFNGSSDYVEAYAFVEAGASSSGFISYTAFYGWRLEGGV